MFRLDVFDYRPEVKGRGSEKVFRGVDNGQVENYEAMEKS